MHIITKYEFMLCLFVIKQKNIYFIHCYNNVIMYMKNIYHVHFTTEKYILRSFYDKNIYNLVFGAFRAHAHLLFNCKHLFLKANFLKIWIIRKPCEVPHKIGPARFSCFDVYWIQTDKQSTFIDMFNVHFTSMGVFMFVM